MKILIEVSTRYEVDAFDFDAFVAEFEEEWLEFLEGEEPTDSLRREFVMDSAYEMGVDFLDAIGAESYTSDDNIDVEIT